MAKQVNKIEEPKDQDSTDFEGKKIESPENTIEDIVIEPVKDATCMIRISEEIHATIGGVAYNFSKKSTQTVPVGVAAILCNSGKAFRL